MGGIVLLAAIMPLILGLLMWIYWNTRKVYPGFGVWTAANLTCGAAYVMFGLYNDVSPIISVVLANTLGIYSIILIYEGTELFFERPRFNLLNYLILGTFLAALLYLTLVQPNQNGWILLCSAVLAFMNLRVAHAMIAHSPRSLRGTSRTIALIFILTALFSFLRGAYAFRQTAPLNLFTDRTLLASAFASICALTVWTFYFLFLNSARVELDLENTSHRLGQAAVTSRRELSQLALLDEVGQLVSESLDEAEIVQRAVGAVVERFGYTQAAICMIVDENKLEVQALSGTEDHGYHRGYRQSVGEGIIGHVARTGQVYVAGDIEQDPYDVALVKHGGSAAAIPLSNEGQTFGVLYVESNTKNAFKRSDVQMLRALSSHVVTAVNKARLHASTQEHLVVMTTLHTISQIITSSLEIDRIFQTVLQLLKDTFGYTHISIYLLEGDVLQLGAQLGYPERTKLAKIPVTTGIMGRTVQTRQIQFLRDVNTDPAYVRAARDVTSEICVPLFKKGSILGVINVEGSKRKPLLERDVDVLTALAGPIAIAIDNAHLHAQAKALARIDGLTDLMNRRTFDQTLEAELARATRYEYPLSLIIIDIDDFKASNDRWGHLAGDALIRATAKLIRNNIRSSDSAARYGGDEFAVILPNTSLNDGVELAERLRSEAEKMGQAGADETIPPGQYTISVGVASYPAAGRTADELLLAADHAELLAKQQGKNRVCATEVPA